LWRQGEHLEDSAIKSYQLLLNQSVSCFNILIEIELQQRADGIIAVERKTMPVRDKNQKQIQKQFPLAEGSEKAISEETVWDEAKAPVNTPDALGIENSFPYHGRLLIYDS
jgi:hypothetical protein